MSQFKRRFAIHRLYAIACVLLLPVAAHPQEAETTDKAAKPIEEIIVTGSLIPQTNMISSSPITEISTQDVLLGGYTDTSRLLNDLPQVFQNSLTDFSSTSNPLASPGGMSTVNLRGLGPQRTLVLVNGRRLGVGDANTGNPNPAPDINQIPTQLIERVDVVTGGASAIYGSDAVAGVVNFIMKKDFEGVELDYQYGFARHENHSSLFDGLLGDAGYDKPDSTVTDGKNYSLSVLMGSGIDDGKGNVTAYFTYRKQYNVLQGDRDFSACKLDIDADSAPFCNGSPNSNEFINVFDPVRDYQVSGNDFVPWGTADTSPPAIFNSNPYQSLSAPDSRYTAGVMANEEITDKINAYFEFNYMDDKATTTVAPSAAFLGGNPFDANGGNLINCDNPLLSPQQVESIGCNDPGLVDANGNVDVLVGRRSIEGAGRTAKYEHENFRYTLGANGEVGDSGWNYDTYFQYYYSTLYQSNENYLSNTKINKALQVVDVDGVPTCKSKVDGSDTSCVPWNIFSEGGVTPDQVNYLNSLGTEYGTVAEKIVSGQVTSDLGRYGLQLPWATDGVGIALGAQYRYDALQFQPDQASTANDLSGFGGAATAIDDSIYVMEEYVELRVPLVQGKDWAEELLFETAYRTSDYNLAGRVGTFKFGLQWQPVDDVRFRTSFNRAIRAPNIIDLFTPASVTNTSVVDSDPCAPTADGPATASLEECLRTGVTAAQYGDGGATSQLVQCPAGQCSILQGGNTQLKPETADTFSIGLTFTPTFIENFTASLDYYEIKVDNIIGSISSDISLQTCLNTGQLCSSVVRTPTGNLFGTTISGGGYVIESSQNISQQTISGVDVQLNYVWTMPDSWGDLSTALVGTWLDENKTTNYAGAPQYDCAGLYGATCQTLNPDWRSTLRVSWTTPWDLLLSVQWRYIDGMQLDTNSKYTQLNNGEYNGFSASLPSVSYFDLSAIWNAPYGIDVRAGIDNIFDKDPPPVDTSVSGTGSANSFPSYDYLGQVFFAGVTKKF
jgi:iron complex outermembrane recepter protein